MAIENRNLEAGTRLAARYKGREHSVLVLIDDQGKPGYEPDDATIHKSLSAAGSAVMGGQACNGWRFWSLADELPAAKTTAEEKGRKPVKLIRCVPNQKGVDDGQVKWFCSSCMKSFLTETADEPDTCPQGHPKLADDDLPMA